MLLTLSTALAHDAQTGMTYPFSCCGGQDCKPVPCDELVEQDNGWWEYLPTHTPFPPHVVQPSQDRFCHICVTPSVKQGRCAFIHSGV